MSSPAPGGAPIDAGAGRTDAEAAPKKRARSALSPEDRGLLFGIPILIVLVLAGWAIWRANADLGDIELRQLAWDNVATLLWQHIKIVVISAVIVMITAVPIGVLLTRKGVRTAAPIVTAIANAGQAAPVIGVIVLLAIWLGFGVPVAVLALVIYAFLPVLANTITGLRSIDPALKESARGMGMSPLQVLFRVELPIAVPVIMTGARTALVLLVGAGAFATFIDAGGLGSLITTGITLFRFSVLVSGAIFVAVLALAIEWLARVLELVVKPKGL
ncbi:ABC transporter permease [Dietzia sp.]|uniref:ABC transporter permease n=1 Tax=Dietzia sp. TaxID=1871616 RepID=UPI002FDAD009